MNINDLPSAKPDCSKFSLHSAQRGRKPSLSWSTHTGRTHHGRPVQELLFKQALKGVVKLVKCANNKM